MNHLLTTEEPTVKNVRKQIERRQRRDGKRWKYKAGDASAYSRRMWTWWSPYMKQAMRRKEKEKERRVNSRWLKVADTERAKNLKDDCIAIMDNLNERKRCSTAGATDLIDPSSEQRTNGARMPERLRDNGPTSSVLTNTWIQAWRTLPRPRNHEGRYVLPLRPS